MMNRLLEVCCADVESIDAALEGGADRIELCTSLETGGLTPSAALIDYAVKRMPGRVNVLIRPRAGDFLYTTAELEVILDDIRDAVNRGVNGIVCGALNADGTLDTKTLSKMLEAAAAASFTLHRAFDMCRDPQEAVEQSVALGIDRILTSGLAPNVTKGAETLRQLKKQAAGRIIILAGGGVGCDNAARILRDTGVSELHASCKHIISSRMKFRRDEVSMSAPGSDEFSRPSTSARIVARLAEIIHNFDTNNQ